MKKLADSGIDVNCAAPNQYTSTPLHYASLNGHLEVAKLLLEKGANVNCQDDCKWTPLHYASESGHLEVAKLLLEKGANVICQDIRKLTPLHYASMKGHLEVVKLLLEKGANINSQNSHNDTPLYIAAFTGKKELVKLLLDNGCDINLKDKDGKTAEEIAVSEGYHEIVELISQKRLELLSLNQSQPSLSPSAPPMEENASAENPEECKICFEAKDGIFAFSPCFHAPACEQCCRRIVGSSESTCPICRSQVTDFKKIFL